MLVGSYKEIEDRGKTWKIKTYSSQFENVNGLMVPTFIEIMMDDTQKTTLTVTDVQFLDPDEIDDNLFTKPMKLE